MLALDSYPAFRTQDSRIDKHHIQRNQTGMSKPRPAKQTDTMQIQRQRNQLTTTLLVIPLLWRILRLRLRLTMSTPHQLPKQPPTLALIHRHTLIIHAPAQRRRRARHNTRTLTLAVIVIRSTTVVVVVTRTCTGVFFSLETTGVRFV